MSFPVNHFTIVISRHPQDNLGSLLSPRPVTAAEFPITRRFPRTSVSVGGTSLRLDADVHARRNWPGTEAMAASADMRESLHINPA